MVYSSGTGAAKLKPLPDTRNGESWTTTPDKRESARWLFAYSVAVAGPPRL